MKKLLLLMALVSLPSYSAVSANVSIASDYIWRGMTQTATKTHVFHHYFFQLFIISLASSFLLCF